MEQEREQIYLAALLHDIGKFYQRADTGSVGSSKFLSAKNKNESVFCPQYNGYYSHKHCLWTAQFIDDYFLVFDKLVKQPTPDNLYELAAMHHFNYEQLGALGKIIKEADCLSSGMDRSNSESLKDDQDEKSWDSFKKKRMVSIFEGIDNDIKDFKYHLPLEEISLRNSSFPKQKFDNDPDYEKLWKNFNAEFKFIQANTYKAFSETLLNLMFKYMTSIPSSTINFPDVSLYDHSKTTAAIAICLYDYYKEHKNGETPFILIGADLSGIQSYLYQIVSKYASKNLKGRSFYLRLMTDSIVRYILKELDLFQANIIYNSGGGFYLLAPNTKAVKEKLNNINQTIEKNIFQEHGTSLYIAIDSVDISKNAMMHGSKDENLGKIWEELFKKREQKKNSKYSTLITSDYERFFEPLLLGGENKRDIITGEEFIKGEKLGKIKIDGKPVKEITSKQIELGEQLKQTDFIVVSEVEIPYWKDLVNINPLELGFYYYLVDKTELKQKAETLSSSADKVSVITLNGENGKCNFIYTVKGINNIYSFEFYGGNKFENASFENMCNDTNLKRLGVLRMDVDNLGRKFQIGIKPERSTLSRYSALSRSFDYFFSGYLNTIWEEINPKQSFIIYSGGDDVFIVGSWDVTIDIAKRISNDFKDFTCKNESFSLSGGISLVPIKFPIMKAAEQSGEEEKKAKSHICGMQEKNALSFLNFPLNWDYEFPVVEKLKDHLIYLTNNKKLNKSFISKILQHNANAEIKNHKITKLKSYWMITYDLSRLKTREKSENINYLVDNCVKEICGNKKSLNGIELTTNYHTLELWALAARWAELEIRTINN